MTSGEMWYLQWHRNTSFSRILALFCWHHLHKGLIQLINMGILNCADEWNLFDLWGQCTAQQSWRSSFIWNANAGVPISSFEHEHKIIPHRNLGKDPNWWLSPECMVSSMFRTVRNFISAIVEDLIVTNYLINSQSMLIWRHGFCHLYSYQTAKTAPEPPFSQCSPL